MWASLAIGAGFAGLLIGAAESRRSPRSAPLAVIGNIVAIVAGLGALLLLTTLPDGS